MPKNSETTIHDFVTFFLVSYIIFIIFEKHLNKTVTVAKLKQYYLTTHIRGVEVDITCATTSKKNFAAIIDKPVSYVNAYVSNGIEIQECMENPDKLYFKRGLGGETLEIFEKDKIYSYDEAAHLIDEHRSRFANTREWHRSKAK